MSYLQVRLGAAPSCRSAVMSMSNTSRCFALRSRRARWLLRTVLLATIALRIAPALAQAPTPTGNLTDLVDSGIYAYNGLEIAAAKTNDAAYGALLADGCGAAPPPVTGTSAPTAPTATCSANQMLLFQRLRELEDTANGLLGRGETTYSLRLGAQAVGFALRWTADEEYAAQGSLTNKFANSQLTTLANRFSALRFATA